MINNNAERYERGEIQREQWRQRHGLSAHDRLDWLCPCLLGTRKRACGGQHDSRSHCIAPVASLGPPLLDHPRTYFRDRVAAIMTSEPYAHHELTANKWFSPLIEWSARTGVAVFSHPSEEGHHNPGACVFLAFVPLADARAYSALEARAALLVQP